MLQFAKEKEIQLALVKVVLSIENNLEHLQKLAILEDTSYKQLVQLVYKGRWTFPSMLEVKVLLLECFISLAKELLFQNKYQVLDLKELCTKLIQATYNLIFNKHLRRKATIVILIQ